MQKGIANDARELPGESRLKGLDQFRHSREQVCHQPVVGHPEDRRLFVLVDGDDGLRCLHAGAVLDRARLMDRVWGDALESGERTVDTHVKTVRAKLRAIAPDADPIRTVRGLGYSVHVD